MHKIKYEDEGLESELVNIETVSVAIKKEPKHEMETDEINTSKEAQGSTNNSSYPDILQTNVTGNVEANTNSESLHMKSETCYSDTGTNIKTQSNEDHAANNVYHNMDYYSSTQSSIPIFGPNSNFIDAGYGETYSHDYNPNSLPSGPPNLNQAHYVPHPIASPNYNVQHMNTEQPRNNAPYPHGYLFNEHSHTVSPNYINIEQAQSNPSRGYLTNETPLISSHNGNADQAWNDAPYPHGYQTNGSRHHHNMNQPPRMPHPHSYTAQHNLQSSDGHVHMMRQPNFIPFRYPYMPHNFQNSVSGSNNHTRPLHFGANASPYGSINQDHSINTPRSDGDMYRNDPSVHPNMRQPFNMPYYAQSWYPGFNTNAASSTNNGPMFRQETNRSSSGVNHEPNGSIRMVSFIFFLFYLCTANIHYNE